LVWDLNTIQKSNQERQRGSKHYKEKQSRKTERIEALSRKAIKKDREDRRTVMKSNRERQRGSKHFKEKQSRKKEGIEAL